VKLQAIILAAGTGSRIAAVSGGKPKPLLEVGGKTLIEHQLDILADAGISPVTIVVGHESAKVRESVGNRADYVENPDPSGTNSLYSLWLARDRIKGPVLICNCDLLYHPEIIDRLLDVKGTALAYDSSFGWGREKMKVGFVDGRLRAMSKDLPYGIATGENLGLLCFGENEAKVLVAKVEEWVAAGKKTAWLAEAVQAAAQDVPVHGVDIAGLPWIEIDYPQDLDNARKRVWPQIERQRWKRTVRWSYTRWAMLLLPVLLMIFVALNVGRWMERPELDWDSVGIPGLPQIAVKHASGGAQRWWLATATTPARVELEGPAELRIEVRPILDDEAVGERQLFVTEATVDGKSKELAAFRPKKDEDVTSDEISIGTRDRMKLSVPAGRHVIEVLRAAGPYSRFLVRIRESEQVEPTE